jgi:hypothetical protein
MITGDTSDILNTTRDLNNKLQSASVYLDNAISQLANDYGMSEDDAVQFRKRKMISLIHEALELIEDEND